MKKIIILLFTIILSLSAMPAAMGGGQVLGSPELSVSVSDNEVKTGDNTIELLFRNVGEIRRGGPAEYEERVTTARGVRATVTASGPIDANTDTVAVGNLRSGSFNRQAISLTVPEDTKTGRYEVDLEVDYTYTILADFNDIGGVDYDDVDINDEEYTVTIVVDEEARFSVENVRTQGTSGTDGVVAFDVENTGSEVAGDTTVSVGSSSGSISFPVGDSSDISVGELGVNDSRSVKLPVDISSDAESSEYPLTVTPSYIDSDGFEQTAEPIRISVNPELESTFSVETIDSDLRVDSEGTMRLRVVNQGPSEARFPVLMLPEEEGIVPESTSVALENLEAGESQTVSVDVDIRETATQGLELIEPTIEYRTQFGEKLRSDEVQLQFNISNEIERFDIKASNTTLNAGSSRTVDVTVTNNINEEITDVRIKGFFSSPLDSSNDEAFVSSLESGENKTVRLDVSADGGAIANTYSMSVDVQYTEQDGDTKVSDSYELPVQVTEPDGGSGSGVIAIVGTVGIILIFGVLYYFRSNIRDLISD